MTTHAHGRGPDIQGPTWLKGFGADTPAQMFARGLREDAAKLERMHATPIEIDQLDYAIKYHRSTGRAPMTFGDKAYWIAPYRDRARVQVIMKPVQRGATERALVRALSRAEAGYAVLYVLPTHEIRNTFVPNRVHRLFEIAPHYAERVKESLGSSSSTLMIHFGLGMVKFVGSNVPNEFIEYPTDSLIIDELQRCNQRNLLRAPERLANSKLAEQLKLSRPEVEHTGIHAEYLLTDQKQWNVRDEACGEWQPLEWETQFVREEGVGRWLPRDPEWTPESGQDIRAMCRRCERPFDRLSSGEWVAAHPDREASGYQLSGLFTAPRLPGERAMAQLYRDYLVALSNPYELQDWNNANLGRAYTAAGAKITSTQLEACADRSHTFAAAEGRAQGVVTMGADVGKLFHVRISDEPMPGLRRALWIGTVARPEELDRLMRRYKVRCAVVDKEPELHMARDFQARWEGRVFLCEFVYGHGLGVTTEKAVQIDRTQAMDMSHEDVLLRRNVLPADWRTLDAGQYDAQMREPTRSLSRDAKGRPRYVWTEGSAPDHHRLADTYDVLARALVKSGHVPTGIGMVI